LGLVVDVFYDVVELLKLFLYLLVVGRGFAGVWIVWRKSCGLGYRVARLGLVVVRFMVFFLVDSCVLVLL